MKVEVCEKILGAAWGTNIVDSEEHPPLEKAVTFHGKDKKEGEIKLVDFKGSYVTVIKTDGVVTGWQIKNIDGMRLSRGLVFETNFKVLPTPKSK
ncbi:MAG: hypothetical protein HW400_731 [Candidatus Levybacteria bacterium]|nr:hypothetical protein [Candidatus Levybacteria bacterium]